MRQRSGTGADTCRQRSGRCSSTCRQRSGTGAAHMQTALGDGCSTHADSARGRVAAPHADSARGTGAAHMQTALGGRVQHICRQRLGHGLRTHADQRSGTGAAHMQTAHVLLRRTTRRIPDPRGPPTDTAPRPTLQRCMHNINTAVTHKPVNTRLLCRVPSKRSSLTPGPHLRVERCFGQAPRVLPHLLQQRGVPHQGCRIRCLPPHPQAHQGRAQRLQAQPREATATPPEALLTTTLVITYRHCWHHSRYSASNYYLHCWKSQYCTVV